MGSYIPSTGEERQAMLQTSCSTWSLRASG